MLVNGTLNLRTLKSSYNLSSPLPPPRHRGCYISFPISSSPSSSSPFLHLSLTVHHLPRPLRGDIGIRPNPNPSDSHPWPSSPCQSASTASSSPWLHCYQYENSVPVWVLETLFPKKDCFFFFFLFADSLISAPFYILHNLYHRFKERHGKSEAGLVGLRG